VHSAAGGLELGSLSFKALSLMSQSTTDAAFSLTAFCANNLPRPIAAPVMGTVLPATVFIVCPSVV
jgi:hypothetical protein